MIQYVCGSVMTGGCSTKWAARGIMLTAHFLRATTQSETQWNWHAGNHDREVLIPTDDGRSSRALWKSSRDGPNPSEW